MHSWASAFRHPVFQSGTEAFQYRTGSPASDGLGYTLYVNIVGGEKEYAVHPACTAGGEINTPCTSTLPVVDVGGGQGHTLHVHSACSRKGYTMYAHTAGGGKDTPCTIALHIHTILMAVEMDTPCTSILMAVKRDTPCTSIDGRLLMVLFCQYDAEKNM